MKRIHIIYIIFKGLIQYIYQTIIDYCTPWRRRKKPYGLGTMDSHKVELMTKKIHPQYTPQLIRAYIGWYNSTK